MGGGNEDDVKGLLNIGFGRVREWVLGFGVGLVVGLEIEVVFGCFFGNSK